MDEQTTVVEKIAQLLVEMEHSAGNSLPHKKVSDLYEEFFRGEREKDPKRQRAKIQKDFGHLFGMSPFWANSYGIFGNLRSDLKERVGRGEDLHIPFLAAVELARNPPELQLEILEQAERLSRGKKGALVVNVRRLTGEARQKRKQKLSEASGAEEVEPEELLFNTTESAVEAAPIQVLAPASAPPKLFPPSEAASLLSKVGTHTPLPVRRREEAGAETPFVLPSWLEIRRERKSEPGPLKQPPSWKGKGSVVLHKDGRKIEKED